MWSRGLIHAATALPCVATISAALIAACSEPGSPARDRLALSPPGAALRVGDTLRFTATAGASQVAWITSDPARLSVSETGLATALVAGAATITAVRGIDRASAVITIAPCILLSPTISPGVAAVAVGDSLLLQVQFQDCRGPSTGDVIWATSNATVATVESRGLVDGRQTAFVRARAPGQAVIRASLASDPVTTVSAGITVRTGS